MRPHDVQCAVDNFSSLVWASVALTFGFIPVVAHADWNAANDEANRQHMMNDMRATAYRNDQVNTNAINSSSGYSYDRPGASAYGTHGSTAPPVYYQPYVYQPKGPGEIVATYEFTIYKQESEAETIARVRREAEAGNAQSQFNIGRIYYTGYGMALDLNAARYWFCEAAKQDHPIAKSQCANMMYSGQGGDADPVQAMVMLKETADKGEPYGQALYGLNRYVEAVRQGAYTADAETIDYLVKAADQGEAISQALLGSTIYYFAEGGMRDDTKAIRYLRMCDAQHLAMCTGILGNMIFSGYSGLAVDQAEGIRMMKMAAQGGYLESAGILAGIYNTHQFSYYDEGQALYYARLGAKGDEPDASAEYTLGLYYLFGKGVAENPAEAVRLMVDAAKRGDAQAQFTVGNFNHFGESGFAQNDAEAIRWYRLSAEQGFPPAVARLAEPELVVAAKSM